MIIIKSQDELAIMRQAGVIVAEVLLKLQEIVKAGMTTRELDEVAAGLIRKAGAVATFVGYQGYEKTLCTSVNEEVVHGIPSGKVIQAGDIIGIDCGVTYKGFVADHAMTLPVGEISAECQRLLVATQEGLAVGIHRAAYGLMGDIGELRNQFGGFFLPDNVSGLDPLARCRCGKGVDLVAIHRAAHLQAVGMVRLQEEVDQPSAVVVEVAKIAAPADDGTAAVA